MLGRRRSAPGFAVPLVLGVGIVLLASSLAVPWRGSAAAPAGSPVIVSSVAPNISILPLSSATPIPRQFWGINVDPSEPFNLTDAQLLATTPVTYVRYPGGFTADGMNYTSGVITDKTGFTHLAVTSPSAFVSACRAVGCHAILGLPAEIDSPSTAAYYVSYVEKTLGFTPAYWEVGNEPSAWHHFDQPWSTWSTAPNSTVTVPEYTALLLKFTSAIRAVDPTTPLLAPAVGDGAANGTSSCSVYCGPVAAAAGSKLAAISVHSYTAFPPPASRTLESFFSTLRTSPYALATVVPAYRSYIAGNYSGTLPLFLDEVTTIPFTSGGEATFASYTSELYGGLFDAAQITLLLAFNVADVDWFEWAGSVYGWDNATTGALTPTGQVFQTFMSQLAPEYDPTTVIGPSTLYAAATTDGTNLSLLVVNVNTTGSSTFPLSTLFAGTVKQTSWAEGSTIAVSEVANTSGTAPPLSVNVWRGRAIEAAAALTASPSALPNPVEVGTAATIAAGASGGTGRYTSYVWSGTLPAPCSFPSDRTTASFSCTPGSGSAGSYAVTVTVTDSDGDVAKGSFELAVSPKTTTTYSVTFSESGLPSGLTWKVKVDGRTMSRTTNGDTDSLTWTGLSNGTYAYSVAGTAGWHQTTLHYRGDVVVHAASVTEPTLVYTEVLYPVTFTEKGLPTGTSWSVTLNGVTERSTSSTITFLEPNGTFDFKVGKVTGYAAAPTSGSVKVKGARVSVKVDFSKRG